MLGAVLRGLVRTTRDDECGLYIRSTDGVLLARTIYLSETGLKEKLDHSHNVTR